MTVGAGAGRDPDAPGAAGAAAVRDRLVLGLDVGDLAAATATARRLEPWFATVKVGHELYAEAGPAAFDQLHELGFRVFCDLKLHDIPTTVERAARAHARHGVAFLNAHTAGGVAMMRAFVAGARAGADDAGLDPPVTLGVTVLTSDPAASAFDERAEVAAVAGCDGVVCSSAEAGRAAARGLRSMVPGIRLPAGERHDQARVATPGEAITAGSTWLVIGRTVHGADDPESAAAAVSAQVAEALGVA
ncbi:MAG: orotidine-5'-phosphate decarboxylase [Acidimicrobiia bacterium]|nr:orotidine-5'-phosphate decarboxylase [Acidimicrobiia bacterium]